MKPGYKTTEFWVTFSTQALAVLTLLGVISASDSATLGDALGKCIAGAGVCLANALVVANYIRGRTSVKADAALSGMFSGQVESLPPKELEDVPRDNDVSSRSVLPILIGVGLLGFASVSSAQVRPAIAEEVRDAQGNIEWRLPGSPHVQRVPGEQYAEAVPATGWIRGVYYDRGFPVTATQESGISLTSIFGWRDRYFRQLEGQIAQNRQDNQRLKDELDRLKQQYGGPGNPYQPPIIILPPLQQLPIQGQPRQDLPIGGQPRQDLPIQGPPRQDLPPGGQPRQDLPPGGQPRQQLPDAPPIMPPADPQGPGVGKPFLPNPGTPKPNQPIALNNFRPSLWRVR